MNALTIVTLLSLAGMLSFAGFSVLLQELNNEQAILELQIENQQLNQTANVCQTDYERLEDNFQAYRNAIKDNK